MGIRLSENRSKFDLMVSATLVALVLIPALLWFISWVRFAGKVRVFGAGAEVFSFLHGKENSLFYLPHWRFGVHAKVNTAAAFTLNKSKVRPKRENLIGADGGQFSLDWFVDESVGDLPTDAPIIMIEHGLNGGSSEPCLQKFALRCLRKQGWRTVCIIFRGCCGTPLTTLRSYNGGYTEDLQIALKAITARYPTAPIAIIGYSLGGNMVAKYFGEAQSTRRPVHVYDHVAKGEPIPANVVAGGAVCCPFDFMCTDRDIPDKDLEEIAKRLLQYLEKNGEMVKKTEMYAKFMAQPDRTCRAIDDHFTIHFFNYPDRATFYTDCSARHYLDGIEHPFLFISSHNDPVSIFKAFPEEQMAAAVARQAPAAKGKVGALVVPGGGHLGMFGFSDTKKTFDEELMVKFFASKFAEWRRMHSQSSSTTESSSKDEPKKDL